MKLWYMVKNFGKFWKNIKFYESIKKEKIENYSKIKKKYKKHDFDDDDFSC